MFIFHQDLGLYVCHVRVCVHLGVVNLLAGMDIATIVILNNDMLCANLYNSSCDMTKCALIVAIDWERKCVSAV